MLTILVLFVGLTLATAVIAYWSDNLGKKLGKKRVSLWGLRPRTTATFLTIASSWLIMIFTLGVMLALFSPLRQALLRFDEVKAQERSLRVSKKKLDVQVGGLNQQLTALQDQTATLRGRVKIASDNLAKVREQLSQSRDAATRARREQKSAETEAEAARKSADAFRKREQAAVKRERQARQNLQTVTNQRNATESKRAAAQRELQAAQADLKRASADVKAASQRVKLAQRKVTAAEQEVTRAQNNLTQVQADLNTAREGERIAKNNEKAAAAAARAAQVSATASKFAADLAEERAAVANARASEAFAKRIKADADYVAAYDASLKAQNEVLEAQKTVKQLQEQQQKLLAANEELFKENQLVGTQRDVVLGSDIRVPVGFTLVARTFEEGISFSAATQRLHSIFGAGEAIVAGTPDTPALLPGAELRLATREELLPKVNASDPDVLVVVEEDEIYNSLATAISRSQTPLSVRLIADRNHLEGQRFLYARFIVVPVRLALSEGVELARTTFSEEISDARLFSALLKLADAGRRVAVQNGVMPPLSPDSRDFYAPGSNEQIFEALRKISAQGGRARVRIVTDKAISTADQLSVRFEIEPLATATAKITTRKAPA